MKTRRAVSLEVLLSLMLTISTSVPAQSGRRLKAVPAPPPPPVEEPANSKAKPEQAPEAPPVTAEKKQDYVCTDDGTLARVLDPETDKEQVYTQKQVDTKATILTKPRPSYTREARRVRVQGFVILRVVLSSAGKIGRIRVVRGLPAGLTESGIRAACKIQFQPAVKDGQLVSQSIQVEYVFRLSDSSILRP